MSTMGNDLSPYELARLERIKRNQERLRSLGLTPNNALELAVKKRSTSTPRKKRRKRAPAAATRSSARLKEAREGRNNEGSADATCREGSTPISTPQEKKIAEEEMSYSSYSALPEDPRYLDDHEFQVYAALRAWRLGLSRELDIEPYKVCRNRTLCEIIRRRRNEAAFASRGTKRGHDDATVEGDLLSVWGIGPSKAAADGFGWQMLKILDSDETVGLLELSRKNDTLKIDSDE